MMAKKARLWRWNLNDFTKGLLMAALVPVLFLVEQLTLSGKSVSEISPNQLIGAAIAGGVGYLIKNLGTNSEGKILAKEPEKKVSDNP